MNGQSIIERASLNNLEIRIILEELHSKFSSLSVSKNGFYVYPFETKENMIYGLDIVFILQKISDNMCFYLGLLTKPRIVFIDEGTNIINNQNRVFTCGLNGNVKIYEKEQTFAGLYEGDYQNQVVTIVNKKGYELINLLGTLAHEITHHFLSYYNIRKSTEKENEIFTDITSIYLGFGHLLYPAYKNISYNTDWKEREDKSYSYVTHESTIGYITPETILRAISITCEMKNWNPKELIKNFETGYDRANISRKLLKYRMKLFKEKLSRLGRELKSKRQKTKIQKILTDLERIQNKFYEVKKIMNDTSLFKNKNISKNDGELLVNLTNDIFALSTEEEIKANLSIINEVRTNGKVLKKEIYDTTKRLDTKITIWLERLKEIIK